MLSGLVYLLRAAASLVVGLLGILLLLSAVFAGERSVWAIAISSAIAIAGVLAWPRSPNGWRRDPPTDRQIAFARDLGIQIPQGITKGDLSDLISQAKAARDAF